MKFCPSCGKPLTEGASNCGNCGATIGASATVPAASASQQGGLNANTAAALSYLAGFVTGIIFLIADPHKRDPFVRFHAFQSIFFNVAWIGFWIVWIILGLILSAITKGLFFFIQVPVNMLIVIGGLCLWGFLMYSAYQGKRFRIPAIGDLAQKQAGQ